MSRCAWAEMRTTFLQSRQTADAQVRRGVSKACQYSLPLLIPEHATARAHPACRTSNHACACPVNVSWRDVMAILAAACRAADFLFPPAPAEHLQVNPSSDSTSSTGGSSSSTAHPRSAGAAPQGTAEVAAWSGAVRCEGGESQHEQHPAGAGAAGDGRQVCLCVRQSLRGATATLTGAAVLNSGSGSKLAWWCCSTHIVIAAY